VDDAGAIAALFRLVYESSSHPCKVEAFVSETLERPAVNVWFVAEHEGRLVGCMGMLRHAWNRAWEAVRGLTHPDFRSGGLATALAQRLMDEAWASSDCDLVITFPRNRTILRIISETVRPPLVVVGHDGGINIAGGRREYHLVAMSFRVGETVERLVPSSESLATAPFVLQQVSGRFALNSASGPYPPVLITGNHPVHPDYGPFTFEYHPFCPSDSLEITAYTGSRTEPRAIADELLKTLESFGYVRHVRLAVLVDKTDFVRALCETGFTVTAYLPSWHLQNGFRYDCVLVTRRMTDDEPSDHGIRDLIDYFNQGYAACSRSPNVLPRP
jgi:GNAT superfamily N-acetyltransferase